MPASWKHGESEYATENDGTIKPTKNHFYNLRGFRQQQIGERKAFLKKQFRILNNTLFKKYHINFNISVQTALKQKASVESNRNCVDVNTCKEKCDKSWFIKNHLSWRIDRDNLTDVQMEEMASSKCSQGCCLRRGEAYKYCSKQCWRWYIVEIKDREKHFLQCKTGCDFRCQNMYFAIPIDNNGDNNYCDQYKMKKSVGIGLEHFEPNISPNDEHRDDGI